MQGVIFLATSKNELCTDKNMRKLKIESAPKEDYEVRLVEVVFTRMEPTTLIEWTKSSMSRRWRHLGE